MNEAIDDNDYAFWTYGDLVDRRIVTGRSDLHRKQTALGFPKAVKLGGHDTRRSMALFPRAAVRDWIRSRLAQP